MLMSSGKRIKITYGGSAPGDTLSTGPADTSSTAPGGTSASIPIASPANDEPYGQGRARGRWLLHLHARRIRGVDTSRHLRDEKMEDEQILA